MYEGDPSWSSDGQQIAFIREDNGDSQIWIMDSDGQNQRPITSGSGYRQTPRFSSDRAKIIFAIDNRPTSSGLPQIWVADLTTGKVTAITENSMGAWTPFMAEESTELVYATMSADVFVMTDIHASADKLSEGYEPALSADGKSVLLVNRESTANSFDVFLVDVNDSSRKTQVTFDGQYKSSPSFAGDIRRVLFLRRDSRVKSTILIVDTQMKKTIEVDTTD